MAKARRIDKRAIIQSIETHLKGELAIVQASAKAAHEAATHEDARPENEYDTRGLEASYLAKAQLGRAAELQEMLGALGFIELARFDDDDPIATTAVVELESEDGAKQTCFLSPLAAGLKLTVGKKVITVITPQSPLGAALLGRRAGDDVEVPLRGAMKTYEITSVE
ncbi:GreA/GreB family elongation factor [Myxococcota bacterium]|nr:GreA/GreB family elongation factor [Myxococcota bacterium]